MITSLSFNNNIKPYKASTTSFTGIKLQQKTDIVSFSSKETKSKEGKFGNAVRAGILSIAALCSACGPVQRPATNAEIEGKFGRETITEIQNHQQEVDSNYIKEFKLYPYATVEVPVTVGNFNTGTVMDQAFDQCINPVNRKVTIDSDTTQIYMGQDANDIPMYMSSTDYDYGKIPYDSDAGNKIVARIDGIKAIDTKVKNPDTGEKFIRTDYNAVVTCYGAKPIPDNPHDRVTYSPWAHEPGGTITPAITNN